MAIPSPTSACSRSRVKRSTSSCAGDPSSTAGACDRSAVAPHAGRPRGPAHRPGCWTAEETTMHSRHSLEALPRRAAASVLLLVVLALATGAAAQCPPPGSTALPAGTGEDIEITTPVAVCAGTYHYRNVNVYGGGSLTFADAAIDFWATSILIESQGAIVAGSPEQPIGTAGGRVTFHLYGKDQGAAPFGSAAGQGGQGITCKSPGGFCGVPPSIWS